MIKNVLKTTGIFVAMFAIFAITSAFSSSTTATSGGSDNSCTVTVKYSGGSLATSVKVTTEVSGGMGCSGGRDFYTDNDGEVTLKWADGCTLKSVYVKGNYYSVDYKDDKTYTLKLK